MPEDQPGKGGENHPKGDLYEAYSGDALVEAFPAAYDVNLDSHEGRSSIIHPAEPRFAEWDLVSLFS